ncbi:bestrophin-like domain [Nocardia sp. XZ_19_385]|uniref:bestrophin-like domain n=1 Tax=Nocardia sp. XZ_19_385 TaxID=2769488 RepID=UPI00403F49FE
MLIELLQQLLVPVALAVAAVIVFVVGDRLRPKSWRQADDGSGSMVVDLVNTLFLAVAAFVVVICWQQYDNAHNHTVAESKALVDVYWAAHAMSEPDHDRVQELVRDYTEQVVTDEWTVMDEEGRLSQSTQRTLDSLRDTVMAIQSPDAEDARTAALAGLDAVAQARHDRALDASLGMPGFLYTALWFSTALLLFSALISGVLVTLRSVVMTALLGLVVGAAIVAIYGLDRPFSGANIVSKDAFEIALSRYRRIT